MRIAVETSPLYTTRAGVARYVRGLLTGLRATAEPGEQIAEIGWPVENFGYAQPQRALKTALRELGWARWVAPRKARAASVFHHTAPPMVPFFRGPRHVVTLHDLAVLRNPSRFRAWQRSAGVRRLRRLVHADGIICVSRFTADEAMACLGLPAHRLHVVHEGGWLPGRTAAVAVMPVPLPSDYFLFVGSLEPGKNLALLREVYNAAGAGRLFPDLVIAGTRWAGVAREGAAPPGWHFLGHVSDVELAGLYRGARALLFPSRYEGFGLPVLEALTMGCPVICGPVPSLREIGGEALVVAELTTPAFAAAMNRVLSDEEHVAELRALGLARAAEFSWERCARETRAVYSAVMSG